MAEQKSIPKHLFINEKSTKPVWEVTLLEMKFWAMLEALQDPTVFTTACKSTRYDRPVDFYTMREKIRRFGYNAVNGKVSTSHLRPSSNECLHRTAPPRRTSQSLGARDSTHTLLS